MNMQYTNELTPEIRAELAFAKYADGSTIRIMSGADFLASVALEIDEKGEKWALDTGLSKVIKPAAEGVY